MCAAAVVVAATPACGALLGLDADFEERTSAPAAAGGAGHGGAGGAASVDAGGAAHGGSSTASTGGAGGGAADAAIDDAPFDAPLDSPSDAPSCDAGDACYGGPPGTQGVGACKPGVLACVDGGLACEGEVRPIAPPPPSNDDANCDGAPDGQGLLRWLVTTGTPPVGDAGDGPATSGRGVAITPDGDVMVVGSLSGATAFGPAPIPAQDAFVARLAGADGAVAFAKQPGLTPSSHDDGRAVAVAPSGEIVVAGTFSGAVDLAQPGQQLATSTQGGFVAWLPKGAQVASDQQRFVEQAQGGLPLSVGGVAVDGKGRAFVAGRYRNDVGLEVAAKHFGGPTNGRDDGYVVAFGPAPAHVPLWGVQLAGQGDAGAARIDVDAVATDGGSVWVGGGFWGSLPTAGNDVTSTGGEDGFVLRLEASSGQIIGMWLCKGAGDCEVTALAPTAGKHLAIGGHFSGAGTQILGGVVVPAPVDDHPDGFVVIEGSPPLVLGGADVQRVAALAAHPLGSVVVGGYFGTALALPGQKLTSASGADGFVALLPPTLDTTQYAVKLGGFLAAYVTGLAVHPATGAIAGVGYFDGVLEVSGWNKPPIPAPSGFAPSFWAFSLWP